jgi:hypothetical protein
VRILSTLLLATAILCTAGAPRANAQTPAAESFRLTIPGIKATFSAYTELAELLAADPALLSKFKSVRASLPKEKTNGADTMGMTAATLAGSEPRVANVFRKAGITPQQSSMTMETLVGVIFGEAMIRSANGKAGTNKLPAFVAENLTFYKANESEIQAMFKAFGAKAKSLKVDADDEEDEEGESDQQPGQPGL